MKLILSLRFDICHDIYLLQMGFHLVAEVGNLVQMYESETMRETIQKDRIHKTNKQNKETNIR